MIMMIIKWNETEIKQDPNHRLFALYTTRPHHFISSKKRNKEFSFDLNKINTKTHEKNPSTYYEVHLFYDGWLYVKSGSGLDSAWSPFRCLDSGLVMWIFTCMCVVVVSYLTNLT